jgi:hypothetical protein
MAIDANSQEAILHEISEIRALLTRLQPVDTNSNNQIHTGGGKRVLILF